MTTALVHQEAVMGTVVTFQIHTPAPRHVAEAALSETVRWLHGLYLDRPYPYDDPYRYWRW